MYKKNFLILTMTMNSGGVTTVCINLAIGLKKIGHDVTLRSYVNNISSNKVD